MPDNNQTQNPQGHNDSVINLSEISLIKEYKPKHKFFAILFKKIDAKELMLVRDNIFNGEANIEVKKSGIRTYNPWFQTIYVVDKSLFNINVRNANNTNGLYSLDIGAGDDITVPLRIRARVSQNTRSLKQLMIAKDNYKQNIRAASEKMMKLIVKKFYQSDSHGIKDNVLLNLKKNFNIADLASSNDPDFLEIADVATDLYNTQGIIIEEIDMVDADFSDRVKQIRTENLKAESERKRAELESKNKIQIAKNEAAAEQIKIGKQVKALLAAGFTKEDIAKYYLMQQLPQNTIMSMGNNSNITDVMSGMMAINNRGQNNNQNSNQNTNGMSM